MRKFAHMSDIHIGAFRQPELRSLVLKAFEVAIDRCIEEKVEFVILAGDIFDSNIPDLASVTRAAEKMKEAAKSGIRFYAIYGSHDFSPNYSSMVDVLDGAGLFTKAEELSDHAGRSVLSFVEDPSGVKLCGISGRKLSIDQYEYSKLDTKPLEAEPGLKVFVFHIALEELKPRGLEQMEGIPASFLPSGFAYYAGGHMHGHSITKLPDHPNIAYPGSLFATDYGELLQIAKGEDRGFYLVSFDEERVLDVEFIPLKVCEVVHLQYSAQGKTSVKVASELAGLAFNTNAEGKVLLLTVEGELSGGRTTDIDFSAIRSRLYASRPLIVLSNYSHLTSREMKTDLGPSRPVGVTERELFEREVSSVKSSEPGLRGDDGVNVAIALLGTLKDARKENENKSEYETRTMRDGFRVLGLKEDL